jgi:hypothetical protein
MKRWLGCSVLLFGLALSACAAPNGGYSGRRDEGYYGTRGGGSWELLGQREADFKMDRDRIEVGRREGTFRALRIVVRGAPVEIYDMVVHFADGKSYSPNLRHRFEENSSTREIDLPGGRHVIRSVDFAYRSPNRREGRATVMLYGR